MNQDSRPFHGLPAIRRWGKKPAEERRTSTSGSPIRTGIIHDVEIINYRTDPFATPLLGTWVLHPLPVPGFHALGWCPLLKPTKYTSMLNTALNSQTYWNMLAGVNLRQDMLI
jgi:hypothetical protein